jgi:tRNA threonylcarbamoyladenosine biosynthesis protein TsaE
MGPDGHGAEQRPAPGGWGDSGAAGTAGFSVTTTNAEETQRLGAMLGALLQPGDLLLLQGPLGAGKTTFTQGLARGIGLTTPVTSPSFTLANVYRPSPGATAAFPLFHLDLWRIKSPLEALGIGLEEYLESGGPCVIEWPEIADEVLPGEVLRLRFTARDDQRTIEFGPSGARPAELTDRLAATWAAAHPAKGGADAAGH